MQPDELLTVQFRVDLRGPHVGVSQQLLDGPEVRSPLQEVGGETMAKYVRTHAIGESAALIHSAHAASSDGSPASGASAKA